MARHYGQIMSAIWNDADFRALSGAAQRVYLMLVTQAEISSAGTLAITLKRWSRYARDTPSDALSDALSELESTAFIVQDYASEELLVRSFVKWDGGASNIKRRPAIKAAAEAVESPRLRAVLAAQLTKLGVPHNITDSLSGKASDTPRVVVTEGEYVPQPHPATSGGGTVASDASVGPPSMFCSKHPNGTEERCGPCADARKVYQAHVKATAGREAEARRAALAAIAACDMCDSKGFRLDPETRKPTSKCDHRKSA